MPVFLLAIALAFLGLLWFTRRGGGRLPPGPKPFPIIGNLHQLKSQNTVQQFQQWHREHGPIIAVQLGPKTVISIGSHQVARDLLTQRSHIYSSRPRFPIMDECVFRGLNTVLLPYGSRFRIHQRVHWKFLKPASAQCYWPAQDVESKQLLQELLTDNHFNPLFLRLTYSLNSTLAYGKRIDQADGDAIKILACVSQEIAAISQSPGGSLVELFPALNELPFWLAPWKQKGLQAYKRLNALYERNRTAGEESPAWNWMQGAVGLKEVQGLTHEELTHIIGFIFDVGGEAVSGVMEVFVLAAVTFPKAMQRAQEELDRVVGLARLPTFEDLPTLPYVCAIVTETLRWRSIAPLGFPHMTSEDDEYQGYHIPGGTTILPNHWAMDLDETVFEAATEFRPERWLDNPDLPLAAFGFGRRSCGGRHIGKDTLRIVIARLLWAFDITTPSPDGKSPIDPWDMVPGLLAPPRHFQAVFTLRTPAQREVIEREWADVEKDPAVFMKVVGARMG